MDEPEIPGVQTQQPLPAGSPINLTDEEEKLSRDSNAEIRHKAHQALDSLMQGNARFQKVCSHTFSIPCVHFTLWSSIGQDPPAALYPKANHASHDCKLRRHLN